MHSQSSEFKLQVHCTISTPYKQMTLRFQSRRSWGWGGEETLKNNKKKRTLPSASIILPNRKRLFLVQLSNSTKLSSESPDNTLGGSCEIIP